MLPVHDHSGHVCCRSSESDSSDSDSETSSSDLESDTDSDVSARAAKRTQKTQIRGTYDLFMIISAYLDVDLDFVIRHGTPKQYFITFHPSFMLGACWLARLITVGMLKLVCVRCNSCSF